jgi:hypothetical protein
VCDISIASGERATYQSNEATLFECAVRPVCVFGPADENTPCPHVVEEQVVAKARDADGAVEGGCIGHQADGCVQRSAFKR